MVTGVRNFRIFTIFCFTDEKMSVLDDLFSSRREEQYRTGSLALEDRLLSFQRQLEERFKTELKLEVHYSLADSKVRVFQFEFSESWV